MLGQRFATPHGTEGGRAHQAAFRLADTLAVMRTEFELLHAELEQDRGSQYLSPPYSEFLKSQGLHRAGLAIGRRKKARAGRADGVRLV
jgi:hypothetical protein